VTGLAGKQGFGARFLANLICDSLAWDFSQECDVPTDAKLLNRAREPGNPYDGHTLANVIPDMEALIGNTIARLLADKISRPQCAARSQAQGLHLRPEARGAAQDQALAQHLVAPNLDRTLPRTFVQSSLRSEFFTDD